MRNPRRWLRPSLWGGLLASGVPSGAVPPESRDGAAYGIGWIGTIGTLNKTTSNTYNLDGSVATTTYPNGTDVVTYTTGADGRTTSASDAIGYGNVISYATSLVYAPTGQLTSGLFGNSVSYAGILETNSYNSRGQPIRLQDCGLTTCTDGSGSGTPYLLDQSYNYGLGVNDNGNVLAITDNAGRKPSQTFTYDGLNRLLTAQGSTTWGINFASGIDAWGNLTQTGTLSGTSTNPMSMSQAVNVKNQFTLGGYTYDAVGNVLTDGSGNTSCSGATYTWNAEEEIICALGASYTYDGDGIRVQKTGGDSTPTIYWGAGTLAESDTSGNLTSEYVFVNGRRIARRDVSTGNVYYLFADMLVSSNVVATSAGALENESQFYPYGGERVVTQGLTNQKYKFEGKERDPESASTAQPQGLDNFGARFDSSATGRFMSPDWANKPEPVPYAKLGNPQTLNLYAFAGNNPESAPDIDGHTVSLEQYQASLWSTWHPDQMGDLDEIASESSEAYFEKAEQASAAEPQTQNGTQAQQQSQPQYGRQPNGSYLADPAKVKKAIKAKKPILEPGNPDHKSECVFACNSWHR